MALALSAAPLLGVELSAEDVLLERLAPPKLVHNVAVCSRWSPRYEALHVLPWLAHHNLLGVDHFFMYLAPPYTNASSPLELRVRALVAASPMVTLLQTDRVPTILGSASEGTRSLDTEGVSLVDCMQRLRRSARWGLGFLDIDELLVVGDVRAATHGQLPSARSRLIVQTDADERGVGADREPALRVLPERRAAAGPERHGIAVVEKVVERAAGRLDLGDALLDRPRITAVDVRALPRLEGARIVGGRREGDLAGDDRRVRAHRLAKDLGERRVVEEPDDVVVRVDRRWRALVRRPGAQAGILSRAPLLVRLAGEQPPLARRVVVDVRGRQLRRCPV